MAQARHCLRFALEPRQLVRSRIRAGEEHLQSDGAVQAQVLNISTKTVQRRLNHALVLLAETLSDLRPDAPQHGEA